MTDNLQAPFIYLYPVENSGPHKTDKYELVHDEDSPVPILRRGLKFTMAIRFSGRGFKKGQDLIRLLFNFGPNPNALKGTRGVLRIDGEKKEKSDNLHWYCGILAQTADCMTLEVFSPPDSPVGIWNLQVETSLLNSQQPPSVFDFENDIYFLFNPWNCKDLVYMPDERLLDEYVLTDVGKIWVGPYGSSRGREWVFGQFDACVLPAAMLVLERSQIAAVSYRDPVRVTRSISKLVNSNDDDGVLVGRWDGDYEDGTAPAGWTGSVPILLQFLETQEPVNYGQCWVFSGVTTTICRALGIPSRVVSNLVSAHDANATLTVDKYYDAANAELEYDPNNPLGEDSIWNYHVWNDVWMARPDLPTGYGGWQAIDATPQETSDGVYQCGPASLEAIKKGSVGFNYDVAFMVASVNADLMRWKENPEAVLGYSKIWCNKYHIGRIILTKQPFIYDPNGDKDREDITDQYKAKEGSEDERLALYNAVRGTELAKSFYSLPEPGLEDVVFDLVDLERIKIGENFCVTVNIQNNSNETRHIEAILSAGSVFYTGIKATCVKRVEGKFTMDPHSTEKISMVVTADEYIDKLVEYCIMKLYAIATITETRQTWADEDDFQVIKPTISIKVPQLIPMGKPTTITLKFANPLKKMLTNCKFNVAGSSLVRNQTIPYPDARPSALIKVNATIIPKFAGEHKIVATFVSKELVDVTGTAKIDVYDESE